MVKSDRYTRDIPDQQGTELQTDESIHRCKRLCFLHPDREIKTIPRAGVHRFSKEERQ